MRLVSTALLLAALPAFAEPKESCEALRKTAKFSAFFERVDIEKLVQTVSDATCKTFILGENVKGKISIVGPENGKTSLDGDQFYAVFLAALDANGLAVYGTGTFMRIIEKPHAKQASIAILSESDRFPSRDEVVTRVFKLRHADLEAVKALLAQFVSPGADVTSFPPDVLIVSDLGSNLARLDTLLQTVDVEHKPTEVTRIIPIAHADATQLADEVTKVLAPKPGAKGAPAPTDTLTLTADERSNRIVVVASPALLDQAVALIAQLDIPLAGEGRAHVYKLVNAEAKEIATNLEAITQGGARPRGPQGGGAGGIASVSPTTGDVRISANESLNALIIVANPGDFRNLSTIIEELDAPLRQVFIETVIMEVNTERDTKMGLSGHVVTTPGGVPFVLGSEPDGAPASASVKNLVGLSGLLAGVTGPTLTALGLPQFGITLQALATDSDVNVISTPHILTTDNKEAEIEVGQRIPFQQGVNPTQLAALAAGGNAGTATTLATFGGSVTRERVELKLTVKPHIGDGENVRLEINQQAEELAGSNSLGPITSTRGQKTSVVAQDDETIVLGGIMQDRVVTSASKTPFLGDIPIIGRLFRYDTSTKTKVNLLVFLTPHIIRGPEDFRRIMKRKVDERRKVLEQAYGSPGSLPTAIDFTRKPGPLMAMQHAVQREKQRPENGGSGAPGERLVQPKD